MIISSENLRHTPSDSISLSLCVDGDEYRKEEYRGRMNNGEELGKNLGEDLAFSQRKKTDFLYGSRHPSWVLVSGPLVAVVLRV